MKKVIILSVVLFGIVILYFEPLKTIFTSSQKISKAYYFSDDKEYKELKAKYSQEQNGDLKIDALNFLLVNMPLNYSFGGKRQECFNVFFEKMEQEITQNGTLPEEVVVVSYWDSLKRRCNLEGNFRLVSDAERLDYDFLQKVIDESFHVWKNRAYAKKISFKDFKDYILPYRSQYEPIEDNYDFIQNKYSWLPDSMRNASDPIEACILVNNNLKSWFRFHYILQQFPGNIAISNLYKGRQGICSDMANLACVTMRNLGIPVSVDYAPQWGNKEKGHDWNVVFNKNMIALPFMGAESNPGEKSSYFETNIPAKVYRRTFDSRLVINEEMADIPPFFRERNKIDVTNEYVSVSNVIYDIDKEVDHNYVYANVFSCNGWNPIGIGNIQGSKISFEKLGRGVVYLPTTFQSGVNAPIAYPFVLSENGDVSELKPDYQQKSSVTLERKYPLYPYILEYVDKMIGGKFQGANDPDFKNPMDLYVIEDRPDLYFQEVKLDKPYQFRYFRYLSPDDGYADVAEIEVYNNAGKLTGEVINQSKWDIAKDAFDGNIDSFFATAEAGTGEWVGLSFSKPQKISKIRFLPRNDNNYIMKGNRHELFYWDNKWISLGQKIPDHHTVSFEKVPSNALLWLRNLDYGREERIFIIKEGKQKWF